MDNIMMKNQKTSMENLIELFKLDTALGEEELDYKKDSKIRFKKREFIKIKVTTREDNLLVSWVNFKLDFMKDLHASGVYDSKDKNYCKKHYKAIMSKIYKTINMVDMFGEGEGKYNDVTYNESQNIIGQIPEFVTCPSDVTINFIKELENPEKNIKISNKVMLDSANKYLMIPGIGWVEYYGNNGIESPFNYGTIDHVILSRISENIWGATMYEYGDADCGEILSVKVGESGCHTAIRDYEEMMCKRNKVSDRRTFLIDG